MKERPILMSAPMVRATLSEVDPKTQTRRIMKPQPYPNGFHFDGRDILTHNDYLPPSALLLDVGKGRNRCTWSDVEDDLTQACPYGVPGDRLWVREAWAPIDSAAYDDGQSHECALYRADEALPVEFQPRWRPSIHMPRVHSRITLEITEVRVERLQDISADDCEAEGARAASWNAYSARLDFRSIWESINGLGSWDANPWVWAVSFRRI